MISSTRSSESASRSSWKEASSVMSASSIPSCSVRTSLTRSKTSSRDAAMSPHLWISGAEARRSYSLDRPGKPCCEPPDDVVVHSTGGQPDGVGDGGPRRVAVRDDGQAAEAEQVRAAVRVGVEALPQPSGSGTDEEPADGAARIGGDLLAECVEQRGDRPLEELERDVPGEAVGDDDVGRAAEDVAALAVATEVEVARGEELMRLERELVALLRLLADGEQAHFQVGHAEDLLGEDGAHGRELDEVLRARV